MRGDFQAAKRLFWSMTKDERAGFIPAMYRYQAPLIAFQYFLRWAWVGGSNTVRRAAGDDHSLVRLFMRANYEIPRCIGPVVKAYRGTHGISPEHAAAGLSWSLDRDVACDFAYRLGYGGHGSPLVIEAHIPRAHILMCADHVNEGELVVIPITSDPTITYQVSSPVDDWLDRHLRRRTQVKEDDEEMEKRLRALETKATTNPEEITWAE